MFGSLDPAKEPTLHIFFIQFGQYAHQCFVPQIVFERFDLLALVVEGGFQDGVLILSPGFCLVMIFFFFVDVVESSGHFFNDFVCSLSFSGWTGLAGCFC